MCQHNVAPGDQRATGLCDSTGRHPSKQTAFYKGRYKFGCFLRAVAVFVAAKKAMLR